MDIKRFLSNIDSKLIEVCDKFAFVILAPIKWFFGCLKSQWNDEDRISDYVLILSIGALIFGGALFFVSILKENIDNKYYAIDINGVSFASKNDDIRLMESFATVLGLKITEKDLYVQAIDHYYKMQGIQLTESILNKFYALPDVRGSYLQLVSSEGENAWDRHGFIIDTFRKEKEEWGMLELLLFFGLMLSQLAAVIFQARQIQLKRSRKKLKNGEFQTTYK